MATRPYRPDDDASHVATIWCEAGWAESGQATAIATFYRGGHALVAPADGQFEAVAHWSSGDYRWLNHDLPLSAITGILTGRIGRRRGLATEVVAESLAQASAAGAALAALSAFEIGYYDRFGFASDSYDHVFTFDPQTLTVPFPERVPVRLHQSDHAEVHDLLQRRVRSHGGIRLDPAEIPEAEFQFIDNWFGVGFRDDDGRLTAAMVGDAQGETGPYRVGWNIYETPRDLLDLLGMLRGLGDQVSLVTMAEPAELHLQDVISTPIRQVDMFSLGGKQQTFHRAFAGRQMRILDLDACMSLVTAAEPVSFDLSLTDPLAERGGRWAGIGGDYHLELDASSSITTGHRGGPAVSTDVGSLTQVWTGARSASSLALLGRLDAPAEVVSALDRVFTLPSTTAGIPF